MENEERVFKSSTKGAFLPISSATAPQPPVGRAGPLAQTAMSVLFDEKEIKSQAQHVEGNEGDIKEECDRKNHNITA